MTRVLQSELLDSLPASDPAAQRSRADLRRVNRWMGHCGILTRTLKSTVPAAVRRIVELGAGDGTLALALATRLRQRWPDIELTLIDRQPVVTDSTLQTFQRVGWKTHVVESDVFDWLAANPQPADMIVTNLFLHHFEAPQLRRLLLGIADRSRCFIALEPRRSALAQLGARSLGLIGCNHVTRHDARVSVQAGFRDRELSALWPAPANWRVEEKRAGLFSHLFTARKIST